MILALVTAPESKVIIEQLSKLKVLIVTLSNEGNMLLVFKT